MAKVGKYLHSDPDDPLDTLVGFGEKHRGKTWKEVCKTDPDYVTWFLSGDCAVPRSSVLEDALTEVMEARDLFPDWRPEERGLL